MSAEDKYDRAISQEVEMALSFDMNYAGAICSPDLTDQLAWNHGPWIMERVELL